MLYRDTAFGIAWNFLLAAVPVVLGLVLAWTITRAAKNRLLIPIASLLGILWLIYLPNSCYLVTELRHVVRALAGTDLYLRARIDPETAIVLMAYTAFYFLYATVGMLAFALAIRPVAAALRRAGLGTLSFGALLFGLMSLGVYLGLIRRYNSWDLLHRPREIADASLALMNHPALSLFLVAFALFLWVGYVAIDIWIDGLLFRLRRGRVGAEGMSIAG